MQEALLPRPPEGMAPGAALALLVHVGLIAALTLAVDWHMTAPEVVSAELWAALPQTAAPQPDVAPPPPPPPPAPAPLPKPAPAPAPPPPKEAQQDAQIATERAERNRREQEKKEQEREREKAREKALEKERLEAKAAADAEKKKREAAEAKADEQRIAKSRDEQMKRMLASLPGSGAATGSASVDAAPSQSYIAKLKAAIGRPTFATEGLDGNPETEVELRMTATGTVFVTNITKPSGLKAWDDAVLRQIERAGTLPRDANGRVPSRIVIVFRPKE